MNARVSSAGEIERDGNQIEIEEMKDISPFVANALRIRKSNELNYSKVPALF